MMKNAFNLFIYLRTIQTRTFKVVSFYPIITFIIDYEDQTIDKKSSARGRAKNLATFTPEKSNREQPRQQYLSPSVVKTSGSSSARLYNSEPRKNLEKNTNFFNTPFKKKGDVQIYTSRPQRGTTSNTNYSTPNKEFKGNVSIFESPDKTYKYVISDHEGGSEEK